MRKYRMKEVTYNAITYGWRNIKNGKFYIGYHKTNEEWDGYITSSENEELRYAWSNGFLKRTVLYKGSVEKAITFENYILKHVDAIRNPQCYNNSVGGGVGCQPFDILTEEMKKTADRWLAGKEVNTEKRSGLWNRKLVRSIKFKIEKGHYIVVEEKTEKIFDLPRNQVRFENIDPKHVDEIKEHMLDPSRARKHISPVIIAVQANGDMLILDGNHTVSAAYLAGWTNIPVIYINSSEFEDSQANYDAFGLLMNHQEKVKKPNDKESCKRAIINLINNLGDINIYSQKFREICIAELEPFYSPKRIAKNIDVVLEMLKEEEDIRKHNFKKYTKAEIEYQTEVLEEKYKNLAVISITSDSSYNAGVGAIMNKMGGMDVWEGLMLISHRNMHEYRRRDEHHQKLLNALKRMHPDCKVDIKYLPCFINTRTNELSH